MPVAYGKLCKYKAIPQATKIYTKYSHKEIYSKVLQIKQNFNKSFINAWVGKKKKRKENRNEQQEKT